MEQKIKPLLASETRRIEEQRSWVRDHYDPEARHQYDTLEGKLRLIETILKENWIEPEEIWKLQCLGIAFGDALVQELGLSWVAVDDEHGRDPALRDETTTIVTFPSTAISKRVERGETVDVRRLFAQACAKISRLRAELPRHTTH